MIKKFLLFLSFTICITTSAVSDSLIAPPILRIFIHPEILKYGISHYIDEKYAEVATDTYQNLMWDDGSVTNNDLNAVCKAGHLENDKCSEFKRFIVGGFHESCGKTKGQPNDNCIDDVFYSALTGTRVTMLQADGLAKEYARVRHNQDIFCSTNFRTHNLSDFVKCRTADGQNYYEFKFNSVENYVDLSLDTSMNAAICKIHGVDYKAAHIKVGGEHVGNQCVTSDEKVCSNINKSAAKFALKTDMQNGICVIQNKHNLTMSNLRTAFGIDNKAFIKGYQLSAYAGMRDQLCDYIKVNATTQITTCECEYGISRITDYSNALTMISQREDVLTCYANGEPIDFVFDDLNEGNKKIQKGGLEAFNCAIVGGTYQGQECFVPDENLCRKIAAATIKDCPECKKAYFDTVRNACVLPNAKIANDHQKKVNTGLIIGGTVVGAVITFVSGGTLGGVSMVLIETIGGTMELGAQIHIDGIADEFFEKANSCNKATCAEEILKEFFQYLSRMPNDLQDGEKLGVDAQMERLITLLPDDSQFLTDMVAACYEPGDDNFDISRCDDGTWNADQVIRAAGIALQFTSVFVSVGKWVLGADRITKIAQKTPHLTEALQRKIPGVKSTLAKKLSSGEKVVRSDGKAVEIINTGKHTKNALKPLSYYVEGLDKIADNEAIVFNIRLSGATADVKDTGPAIKNILEKHGLKFGSDTDVGSWYIIKSTKDNDFGAYELWSPVINGKNAKELMPGLINDFDNMGISNNLILPIKADDFFNNFNKGAYQSIEQNELVHFLDALHDDSGSENVYYSLQEIQQKYPHDKFLFKGATASDDYMMFSGRAGRSGTAYATPDIKYAEIYDGVAGGRGKGRTATGDLYTSSVIADFNGQDVEVGFINIYEQSPNNVYYKNFGIEDYRKRADDPQWYVVQKDTYHAETYINQEANPLEEKILHIHWDDTDFYVPVKNQSNEEIQKTVAKIINNKKADPQQTYDRPLYNWLKSQQQAFRATK